jgi:hypothetical protein
MPVCARTGKTESVGYTIFSWQSQKFVCVDLSRFVAKLLLIGVTSAKPFFLGIS